MTLRFLDFELDPHGYRILRRGEPLHVERRVFDLIAYLATHRDRIVPRDEIMAEVWGEVTVTEHVLDQTLHSARQVFGDKAVAPRILRTIRRRGIQFVASAVEVEAPPPVVFVGREAEMAAIRQCQARSLEGLPQLVLVEGEPGGGKTRLCHEATEPMRVAGSRVFWGQCAESEGAPAFWPWIQAASEAVTETPYPVAPQARQRLAGNLGPSRFGLFDAITDWWRGQARDAHAVVVIDDLHRADEASFELFCFLAKEMRPCRFLLIGAYRAAPEDLHASRRERLREISGRSDSLLVSLGGLDSAAVGEMCQAARPSVPEDTVASVVLRSGGNPFFVNQLLTLSASELEDGTLPLSVASSVRRRLVSLPTEARQVVEAASVLGREFTADLVTQMTGVSPASLRAAGAEAVSAAILATDGRGGWRFLHDLVRESVYHDLEDQNRARLHWEAANAFRSTASGRRWAEVSFHSARAQGHGDNSLTLEAASKAATEALDRFAFEDAIVHLRLYLTAASTDRSVSDETRADYLLLLGRALLAVGRKTDSRAALKEAARLGGWYYLAQAALETSPGIWSLEAGKVDLEATDLLRSALAAIPADELALRSMVGSRLAAALLWSPGSFRDRNILVAEALQWAEQSSDRIATLVAKLFGVLALWLPGEGEARLAEIEELIGEAERHQMVEAEVVTRIFRITTLTELGRRNERERELSRLDGRLVQHPLPEALWYVPMLRASLAADACDWEETAKFTADFVRLGETFGDLNLGHSQSGFLLAAAFHNDRCAEVVSVAAALASEFPDFMVMRAAYALMLAEAGAANEAMSEYSPLVSEIAKGPVDNLWLLSGALVAECAASHGDVEAASMLLDALLPYSREQPVAGYGVLSWGSTARLLGRLCATLGDPREACRHLSEAIQLEQAAGCRTWVGYSFLERGLASSRLGTDGPDSGALSDLARADEIADSAGLPRLKRGVSSARIPWA